MESRLHAPLRDATVHTDERAAQAAEEKGAQAFAVGRHIFFGGGRFDPSSGPGAELLAHELAHVVSASPAALSASLTAFDAPTLDHTAENGARAIAAKGIEGAQSPAEPLAIRRQPLSEADIGKRLDQSNALVNGIQLSATAGLSELIEVMRAIDATVPSQLASGLYTLVYRGRTITLNSAQLAQLRKVAGNSLIQALGKSKRRVDDAVGRYKAQESINDDFPVTSRAVKAWAWVSTFGDYSNPGESVYGQATQAALAEIAARLAIQSGHFAQAIEMVAKSDAASERTSKLVYAYIDTLIEGGDSLVAKLEFTRNAAFLTLGVLAVVVTGGAALGVEAGVVGTGVGGLTVAETATAISVGAPIVANVGAAGIQAALGEKVDWVKVGVDIAVQVILAKFGGKLGAGIAGKIAGPATQSLARQTIAALASGTATHGMSQAFTIAVDSVYMTLRGKDVTWGDYVDALATSLSDPGGWFLVALGSGVHLAAQVKVSNAVNAPKAAGSVVQEQPAAASKPAPASPKTAAVSPTEPAAVSPKPAAVAPEGPAAVSPKQPAAVTPEEPAAATSSKPASPVHPDGSDDAAFAENAQFETGTAKQVNRVRTTGSGQQLVSLDTIPLTAAQRTAAKSIHGQRLSGAQHGTWQSATNKRAQNEAAEVRRLWNLGDAHSQDQARALARDIFDRQRGRYWARVRKSPALRATFENAGMRFTGGKTTAPIYDLPDGTVARMTIEHSQRLTDNPTRAVDANNLQFVLGDENSVNLEFIRRFDPFQ